MGDTIKELVERDLYWWQRGASDRLATWEKVKDILLPLVEDIECTSAWFNTACSLVITLPPLEQEPETGAQAARSLPCRLLTLTGEQEVKKYIDNGYETMYFSVRLPDGDCVSVVVNRHRTCKGRRYKVITEHEVISCGTPSFANAAQAIDLGEA